MPAHIFAANGARVPLPVDAQGRLLLPAGTTIHGSLQLDDDVRTLAEGLEIDHNLITGNGFRKWPLCLEVGHSVIINDSATPLPPSTVRIGCEIIAALPR